ncbi:MAG TPA: hypothetical protein EYN91_12120 [Candidatus Melainabacteria bacterium]|nr:hypothetical protein [Candidatus Melainabacteria bacterium]HIN66581.1 hypothetical protein [Candidatus Obscuribacterales bacterium]
MEELKCSFCQRPRQKVKLLVGRTGNVCDTCLDFQAKQKETNTACVMCNRFHKTHDVPKANPGVCEKCIISGTSIFRLISRGQTWIVFKQEAPSCKPHLSKLQSQNFYEYWLKQFVNDGVNLGTGDKLVDLFQIKPSKRLITYARKWTHAFPNHRDGPRVMSFWLEHFPSKESTDLAAKYLKRHWPVEELHWLFRSVLKAKAGAKLDRLVLERLENAPANDIWARCLSPYKVREGIANRLALRWLKLNEDNPNLLLMGYTTFANTPDTVAAVFKHLKKHGFSRQYNEHEIRPLLDNTRKLNMEIRPEVVEFARNWLAATEHKKDKDPESHQETEVAHVHAALIHATNDETDIENAKNWYLKHSDSRMSFLVLNELLSTRKNSNLKPDQFAIEQAKIVIRKTPLEERIPSLVGTLLAACPDSETIGIASELYAQQNIPWILIELLQHSPTEQQIAAGKVLLNEVRGWDSEHALLVALLKRAPDSRVKRRARAWLKENTRHIAKKEILKLL